MMDLVFLPATDPHDRTYGVIPERIDSYPYVTIHQVRFPAMVWYNQTVRDQAIRQIDAMHLASIVLVGFSKSGLGAWNIARALPGRLAATIIFDAPAAREELPPWSTAAFYPDNAAWLADLPIRHVAEFKTALPKGHRLILISGANFHDEMSALLRALTDAGIAHTFLPRPHLKHHWNSGWIEEALALLHQQPVPTRLR